MATLDEQVAEKRAEREAAAKRKSPPHHPDPSTFDADELTTASGQRITVTDLEFAAMLEKAGGFRTRVAKQLGITASAVTHRIKRSKYLTEVCKTVEETILDLAEAQLIKAAQEGEAWAITFILKCKGRKRGWVERQEIAFGGDPDALPPPIVLSVHDPAFVEAERERQRREFAEIVDVAAVEFKEAVPSGGARSDGVERPESAETSGATAQPSDAGTGNGAQDAPVGAVNPPKAKPKAANKPKPRSKPAPAADDCGIEVETDVVVEYLEPKPPETGTGAAVSRPAEAGASTQGASADAPVGAENGRITDVLQTNNAPVADGGKGLQGVTSSPQPAQPLGGGGDAQGGGPKAGSGGEGRRGRREAEAEVLLRSGGVSKEAVGAP